MFWDNSLGSYPRTGNAIKDLSGNGDDGTLNNFSNPPTPTSGYLNGALQYDGDNDYINFSNAWLTNKSEFTIFALFRRTKVPNIHSNYTTSIVSSQIGQQIRAGNYNQYWTIIIEVTASLGSYYNNCAVGSATSVLLENDSKEFYQVAVCVKPNLIRTYFNGVLNDERIINIGSIVDNRRIPNQMGTSIAQDSWAGNIPVFMGYNRFLEKEDISQIYNYFDNIYNQNFTPSFPKTNLEVMFWDNNTDCYPRTGTTLYDLSGNSNNGTLNNFSIPPTASSGFTNGGLLFNGDDNYISFPREWLTVTTEFTIYAIFRRTGVPNADGSYTTNVITAEIGELIKAANTGGYWTLVVELTASLGTYYNSCSTGSETSILLDPSSKDYYQIAVCVKPNLIQTYFDGVLNDEEVIDIGPITDARRKASRLGSSNQTTAWTGNVPVYLGYERFLGQEEITEIYQYFNKYYK